ncbi:MAG: hypothetical protein IPM54_16355 [Polyangiaceae bacterium]|nr:hypothetical protein [Polyangiaceae bacterium]
MFLRQRAPDWIEVHDEVSLSDERPRIDYLFLRKVRDPPPDNTGRTLCRLWPLIPRIAIAEFKSIGRPYRKRGLARLFAYVFAYFAGASDVKHLRDIIGVLIVPDRTPTLDADVAAMGLEFRDLRDGYWELTGGLLRLYVVEIDRVGDQERDGVLGSFGHHHAHTRDAGQFWVEQLGTKEAMMEAKQLEGYQELMARLLTELPPEARMAGLAPQERLAGLAPQERLAGLAPQERLAGLSREQILLGLPDDELRRLPESYLATFPDSVREEVRKRIGR